jgi:hypothetical protein
MRGRPQSSSRTACTCPQTQILPFISLVQAYQRTF